MPETAGNEAFLFSYSPAQLLPAIFILALASFVQGTIGFASGLIAIPLLVLLGLPLPEAITVNLVASAGQNCFAAWRLRREIPYEKAWRPIALRTVALPLGVLLLWLTGALPQEYVKQIVGLLLLAVLIVQWTARVEPREELHAGWDWIAFGMGGIMLGFCGMGGPPIVLWVLAHRWTALRSRAFLFFIFATGMLPHYLLLLFTFGGSVFPATLLGLVSMPVVLAATSGGLYVGGRLPQARLKLATYLALTLIAVSAIVSPWL